MVISNIFSCVKVGICRFDYLYDNVTNWEMSDVIIPQLIILTLVLCATGTAQATTLAQQAHTASVVEGTAAIPETHARADARAIAGHKAQGT